jgi:putative transposase
MWARGYFAVSTGNVTDEIIKQYIESHKDMPAQDDGNFQIDE